MIGEPTEEQITAALADAATPTETGWTFGDTWHSIESARAITRMCLILGLPVSDIITSAIFLALLDRLLLIEEKLRLINISAVE